MKPFSCYKIPYVHTRDTKTVAVLPKSIVKQFDDLGKLGKPGFKMNLIKRILIKELGLTLLRPIKLFISSRLTKV